MAPTTHKGSVSALAILGKRDTGPGGRDARLDPTTRPLRTRATYEHTPTQGRRNRT